MTDTDKYLSISSALEKMIKQVYSYDDLKKPIPNYQWTISNFSANTTNIPGISITYTHRRKIPTIRDMWT